MKKWHGSVLEGFVLMEVVFLLVYIGIDLAFANKIKAPFCSHYIRIKALCGGGVIFSVYFTLWFRVYTALHSHPLLRNTFGKAARTFNYLTGLLIFVVTFVTATVLSVLYFTTTVYKTCAYGCIDLKNDVKVYWKTSIGCRLTGQIMIFLSLVYPLIRHRRRMSGKSTNGQNMFPVIGRAAIVAGVCAVADGIKLLYVVNNKNNVTYTRYLVYNTNLYVNSVALLLSFAGWKKRLFPFWRPSTKKRRLEIFSLQRAGGVWKVKNFWHRGRVLCCRLLGHGLSYHQCRFESSEVAIV